MISSAGDVESEAMPDWTTWGIDRIDWQPVERPNNVRESAPRAALAEEP